MPDPGESFATYVLGGLDALGLEADDVDLAVMQAAHGLWWPAIQEVLALDLGGVAPEADPDLSRPPEHA